MVDAGLTIFDVQQRLGHSSPTMTSEIYTHLTREAPIPGGRCLLGAVGASFADGLPIRIKIEVNTHERSPARPHIHLDHQVSSSWWTGEIGVLTGSRLWSVVWSAGKHRLRWISGVHQIRAFQRVPPAGLPKDGNAAIVGRPTGRLVIEGSCLLPAPG